MTEYTPDFFLPKMANTNTSEPMGNMCRILVATLVLIIPLTLVGFDGLGAKQIGEATQVRDAVDVCESCIHLALETTLGDADGRGVIEESQFVGQDAMGRFWVSQRGHIAVFDHRGEFIAEVGRSGQGPGEFTRPTTTLGNKDGEVAVFDPGNARVSVLDLSFNLVREFRVPIVGPVGVALPGKDRYVLSGTSPDENRIIQPLHVLEGSEIVRSFGRTAKSGRIGGLMRLALDSRGRIFAGDQFAYRIDAWTAEGDFLAGTRDRGFGSRPSPGDP